MKTRSSFLMSLTLCCFILSSTIFSPSVHAQEANQPVFYVIAYMKVHSENIAEYKKLEKAWKNIHEARMEKGVLSGWFFQEVVSPYGTNTEYNFIAGNIYIGNEMLARHYEGGMIGELINKLNDDDKKLVNRTEELRDMVKEEVWRARGGVASLSDEPAKVCLINFMKLKEGYGGLDLENLENTYWKPLHAERVKKGSMHSWGMYSLEYPSGTNYEYLVGTVDNFDSVVAMLNYGEGEDFEAIMNDIHPDKSIDDILDKTIKTRDIVRTEIRILIDYALQTPEETLTKKGGDKK